MRNPVQGAWPHLTSPCPPMHPICLDLAPNLSYALTGKEILSIVKQRLIKIDKVHTNPTYPAGFMDVISIEKSGEHFRLLYDVKGRFTVHRITPEEPSTSSLRYAKLVDFVKFDTGNMCIITGSPNMGRAGAIFHREKHISGFDVVHVKDSLDRTFATRVQVTNIFVIGEDNKPWISLPKGKGTKLTISEERDLKRKLVAEQ
ncbi:hypothetical protein B0H13DRAFT_2250861 [Mycena leptocephala]|nr:hypothetical protein B0H13DRAFT_2250861 [Mycena leptocephala]